MPLSNYGLNLAEVYRNEAAMRSEKQASTLRNLGIQQELNKQQQMETLRNLYVQNSQKDASGRMATNYDAIAAGMAGAGAGEQVPAIVEQGSTTRKKVMEEGMKGAEALGRVFGSVVPGDPKSMAIAKQAWVNEGLDPAIVKQIPDVMTKEQHDQIMQASMSPQNWMKRQAAQTKAERPSGSIMDQYAVRAAGQLTGNSEIDKYHPDVAKAIIAERKQQLIRTESVSPTGEKSLTFIPQSQLLKGATIEQGKDYSTDVRHYSDNVEKSQISRALPALNKIDELIKKHPNGIPGRGGLKNIGVAAYLLTEEGKEFNRATQWLFNTDLKVVSGGAVTDTEAERAKIANALNAASTAEDYRKAYTDLIKPLYLLTIQGVMGSAPEKVRQQFVNNKGVDLDKYMERFGGTSKASVGNLPAGWTVRTR